MKQAKPPAGPAWSFSVTVTDVPDTGRHLDLVADETVRQAIVTMAGLAALPRLEATFELTRHGTDGLRVVGRVGATVVQHCVVTLDPVESEIDEAVDLTFLPEAELDPAGLQSVEADDPPETLRDGAVDLGAVATEFLLLGMDPYPRKPDVAFDLPVADDPASHPFAVLAALKKPEGPDQG